MKRLNKIFTSILLATIFVLIPSIAKNAEAAFSAVTARGEASEEVNDSSISVSPSANLTVGKIIVVSATTDNAATADGASTLHSISDTRSNTWIKVFEETETDGAANDGATVSLWWTKVTTQIGTGDSVTLTTASNRTAKIIGLTEVTVTAGNTVASTTGYTGNTHYAAAGSNPSHVLSGLTSRAYFEVGTSGAEGTDQAKTPTNLTEMYDTRSGTSASTSVSYHVATRLQTATGDTWTSSAWTYTSAIASLTMFYEVADPTIAVTGTLTSSATEDDVVAGSKTIILTLTNAVWAASGATFDAQRQNIINGIDSAQSEGTGWDAVVKAGLAVTTVVRTSNTVVTVTLSAFATYAITANETITATIPYTALENAIGIVGSPTITISNTTPISGFIYSAEPSTAFNCSTNNLTISVSKNGAAPVTTTCTLSTGAWSKNIIIASGDLINVWVSGQVSSTIYAEIVYVSDGTAKTDINAWQNTLAVRYDTGSSITNANLTTGLYGTKGQQVYAVSSNNLTVDSNIELHVWTGKTYAPGATVTTQGTGNFHVDDNAVATLANATNTIAGDILVDGGATLNINATTAVNGGDITTSGTSAVVTTTSGTHTVTMSGTGSIGGGTTPTLTFYNLATTGTGTTTIANTTTVNNDVSVGTGTTFRINADLTVSGGDITTTTTGIIDTTSGSPTVTTTDAGTIGGGSGTITFYSLTTNGSSNTTTVSSTIAINNALTIGASHTFSLGASSMTVGSTSVSNSGGISVGSSGIISQSSSGTTTIKSSSGGAATIGGAGCTTTNCTFYNLTFAPAVASAPTFTLGSASSQKIVVTNAMTIGDGTNPVTVNAETNDPDLDINGNFVFSACTACSTTFSASSTANFTIAGNFTNVSAGVFTPNSGTVVMDATSGSPKTITSAGDSFNNLSVDNAGTTLTWELQDALDINGNLLIDTSNTLDAKSGGNFNVNVAGNWTNNGTYTARNNLTTFDGAGGTTQVITGATTFYQLTAAATTSRTLQFTASTTYTISNNISLTGTSCSAVLFVRSGTLSTAFTFANSDATPTVSYVDFQDTTVTTNLFSSGTGIINSGGNTGITFDNTCEGGSTSTDGSNYSFQRKTFKDSTNSVHWLFFHDGDQIEYKYSSNNGTTWTRGGSLAYDTNDFSVWQNNISSTEYVWLVVTTSNDILVRRGTLSATSITWDTEANVVGLNGSGASDTYSLPVIALDSSNYMWVGAKYYDGTNYVFKTVRSDVSDTGDATWSGVGFGTTITVKQLSDNQTNSNVYGNLVPLASQDMYATFVNGTNLEGCIWDQSPDLRWEDSSGNVCEGGATASGGPVKIDDASNFTTENGSGRQIVRDSSGNLFSVVIDQVNNDLEVWKSSNGGTSWSEQDPANSPSAIYTSLSVISVAIDSTNKLHIAYSNADHADYVDFTTTFGSPVTIVPQFGDVSYIDDIDISVDSNNIPHILCSHSYTLTSIDHSLLDYFNKVGGSWNSAVTITSTTLGLQLYTYGSITISDENIPEIIYNDGESVKLVAGIGNANNTTSFSSGGGALYDLDTTPSANQYKSSIAIDSSGNTWVSYSDANTNITLYKHDDGTAWTTGGNWHQYTNSNSGHASSLSVINSNVYVFYIYSTDDIAYDMFNGSTWLGETALQTSGGTLTDIKTKWSLLNNNNTSVIDYMYTDTSDTYWASLGLGSVGSQDAIDTTVSSGLTKTISAVADTTNYDVHLSYIDSDGSLAYKRWDNGTVTWQTTVAVDATATDTYPTLSIDTNTRDLYLFYIDSSNGTIYYRMCTMDATECASADWGSETSWHTGTNTSVTSDYGESSDAFAQWAVGTTLISIDWDRISISVSITFTQNAYRWYVDNDGTNPTDPWSAVSSVDLAENSPITIVPSVYNPPSTEEELRLRLNFTINGANLTASSKYFKLQFKQGTDGSCSAGSWTDVNTGAAWAFATSSVTSGTAVTGVLTESDVNGHYVKTKPSVVNTNTATVGQQVEYDFHIVGTTAISANQYSFRIVETDSGGTSESVFSAYTNCPTLTTEPGVSDIMRHGSIKTEGSTTDGFFWSH